MINIENADRMNEFQILQVMADLEERGIKSYSMRPGNGCIWVSYPVLVDSYYYFKDGHIVDVQFD